ncbi:MAG: hypothetical protein HUJ63_01650 [Enterococcus sp.]|nr:hypothetical protein [Enterococcus sp.]
MKTTKKLNFQDLQTVIGGRINEALTVGYNQPPGSYNQPPGKLHEDLTSQKIMGPIGPTSLQEDLHTDLPFWLTL